MQATSRNYPQASQRSPHATSVRRGPAPVFAPPNPHGPALSAQQLQQQSLEELRRRDALRRKTSKPTDRNLPEELSEICIGDGVERYRRLRDVERKLDAVMMQKRLDISEGLTTSMKKEGTLRIWISNTAEGQPWQVMEEGGGGLGEDGTFDFGENSNASFRVKIEGRLLDKVDDEEAEEDAEEDGDAMDTDGPQAKKPKLAPVANEKTKLSHFFKSITIDFDRPASLQPDGYTSIEWKKPAPNPAVPAAEQEAANFDCLEFERKSDEDINVTINLYRDESPERYKLSKPLADLLDTEEEDRAGVVAGIWEYVRAMGLQEDEENRRIVCDEPLRTVFGQDTLFFPHIPDLIHNHLTPLPPIRLPYTIRVDRAYISPTDDTPASQATIYDIRVPLPSPLKRRMQALHTSPTHLTTLKAITTIDEDICLTVDKICHVNAKRKFYDSLARDPANFIQRWISSQKRDLEVMLAEGGRGHGEQSEAGEEFRKGGTAGVWGGQLARESVGLWLARQKAH